MPSVALELFLILLLTLINGILSMAEMALVSARKVRLQQRAEAGDRGAEAALALAESPGHFLSTVQIGITLVGILAGAVGGGTISTKFSELLSSIAVLAPYAHGMSVGIVVVGITFLSLVAGELAPKRLALNQAERLAALLAPPMQVLSTLTGPVVRLLNFSTDLILRLLGSQAASEPAVTEEDVRALIEQGTQVGVFEPVEEEIVDQVFRLSDRTVSALLTPRTDIVWLDVHDTPEEIKVKVLNSGFAYFPIAEGDLDHVLGLVSAKTLLAQSLAGQPLDIQSALQPALFLPQSTPALVIVDRLKQAHVHVALVIDEYGGLAGLVTLDDVLEAIVGDIPTTDEGLEPAIIQREDGSWLVEGMLQIDEFQARFEIKEWPQTVEGYYQTVGGFVMAMLGRIPLPGDHFEWQGYRIEVVDMDGRRVDKILVTRL
ncbi:MAG: hemolysin family protein [Caldilineaceae bacterium]